MGNVAACKTCKKEVAKFAKTCPHCGASNPTVDFKDGAKGLLLVVVVALVALKTCEGSPEEQAADKLAQIDRNCSDQTNAQVMSTVFIKQRLKSPSSADFPFSANVRYLGECRHIVESYVDSQNSFGATVRSQTKALVRYDKKSDDWTLEDITIN